MNSVTDSTSEAQATDEGDLFSVSPKSLTREQLCDHCARVARHCEYTYGDMREYLKENDVDPDTAKYVIKFLRKKYSHRMIYLIIIIISGAAAVKCLSICAEESFMWGMIGSVRLRIGLFSPYAVLAMIALFVCFNCLRKLLSSRI